MFYLTQAAEIQAIIPELASHPILWLDTEVADYNTPSPKLALIQVLAEPNDLIIDETLQRRLLFEFNLKGRRLFRTRMSETVRLFARLRQSSFTIIGKPPLP
ncbi:hypothetical protein [Scytonema sp. NUACC26]|uniref:hypothetical protein n=1 Tax=Scytonema sp. NUACC26 TaxID=3140176 RepID=UPI0034DC262D